MKLLKLIFITVLIAALIVSCTENKPLNNTIAVNSTPSPPPPPAAAIDELASGRKVYEQNCRICHTANGTGGPVEIEGKKLDPDDLTSDKIKKFSDEKLLGYIMNGVVDEGMPAFKGRLSEGEMRDVVKYIRREFHKQ